MSSPSTTHWCRIEIDGKPTLGRVHGDKIALYRGELFEQPQATMKSVFDALRPGGRLVMLDFERIPGVTRPWLLEHVRAGKEVFRKEIEEVGFAFVREIEVPGIEENYVLEFAKPE